MSLDPFTSTSEVRGVFGVSDEELEDATINLEHYRLQLQEELHRIHSGLEAAFTAMSAKGDQRTDVEQVVWRRTRVFATYAVARVLLVALPMFGVKDVSDGKATFSRFADSPYKATAEAIQEQYRVARAAVVEAIPLVGLQGASVVGIPTLIASAAPASDRVTGA